MKRFASPRSPMLGAGICAVAVLGLSSASAYLNPKGFDRLTGVGSPSVSYPSAGPAASGAPCPVAVVGESGAGRDPEEAAGVPSCCEVGSGRGALLAALAGGSGAVSDDAGSGIVPDADADANADEAATDRVPTFTKDIAPLLQANCQECHRPGQVAPFSLVSYKDARKHAFDLATVTADRRMPPWLAAPDFGAVGFRHDRSLSEEQIDTFQAWADAGMPEGDPADLPPAPEFSEGWVLGEPDVVIELPESFEIPAGGDDIYRCFVIPNPLPEDSEVIGLEYKPGNPSVVHHVLGYIDVTGRAAELDSRDDLQGYECAGGPMVDIRGDLGGWAPGANPDFLPEGIGRILPKGSHIILQVHYHPSGKPESDRTRLGLHLAPKDKPIRQALHWWAAGQMDFTIPAGAKGYELVADTLPLPCDVEVHAVSPHMHLLGTDMTMYAETPDGERVDLIRIDDWDFNWQLQYMLERPIVLPTGSVVKAIARYDNSVDNPNQPAADPVDVHYGEATTDEMCFGFFAVTKVGQDLTRGDADDLHLLFREQMDEEYKKAERERERRAGFTRGADAGDE